ncbi:uncharacterized protein (DUF58 family) [Microbacterium endophyticum]|uniref:Uncharacterized protein (DUF58 family) n=1 Tax=Microbacterium endophyticum TaxID=1526412 RepID=A0A7W4YMC5_9MICO|nr:DUF58 domain-containing protein [Microbacterium endophyticum]MBB2976315.1 uncharacterized protein (DUF58 family) [Microbacterium endophyticum]NIK35195.1 uncharacterized protein (DUF58 family) [Microbacterium endophyticum]
MYLSGRIAAAIAAGIPVVVLATAAGFNAWAATSAWLLLCILVVAGDVISAANLRAVRVQRKAPARVRRDIRAETELVLTNNGTRILRGLVRDAWQPTAGVSPQRIPIDIPPQHTHTLVVPLLPRRRGRISSGFIVVRSSGFLGFAGRQRRMNSAVSVVALPPFHSQRHLPSRVARLRELDGNTSVQVRGPGTEFDSLREYVRGDDVRSIDWRATARAGTTMLRTWRPERDRHIVIVVDSGRTAAARVGDGVRLDAAMETALLLSALATRAGDHVHLVMFDRVVRARVSGVDGSALLPALVEAMAPIEARLIDTDWDAAFAQVRRLTNRPSLVVLLTAQDEIEASRGFLGSLPALSSRTRVIVASATDDSVVAATQSRGDAAAVYRAAAAERSLRDAAAVGTAISRTGAETVVAGPEELPPRVADRYIALKSAGLL